MAIRALNFTTISLQHHRHRLRLSLLFFPYPLSLPSPLSFLRGIASKTTSSLISQQKQPQQQQKEDLWLREVKEAETLAQKIGKSIRRPGAPSKSTVYSDVNVIRPKEYWDYESLTVQWGYYSSYSLSSKPIFYTYSYPYFVLFVFPFVSILGI